MSEEDSIRFLGLTRLQFLGIMVALLVALAAIQTYDTYRLLALADQGARSHAAVCTYRANLQQSVSDSTDFLALSPAQRAAKYGQAIANIPEGTILQGISRQRDTIQALAVARCPD